MMDVVSSDCQLRRRQANKRPGNGAQVNCSLLLTAAPCNAIMPNRASLPRATTRTCLNEVIREGRMRVITGTVSRRATRRAFAVLDPSQSNYCNFLDRVNNPSDGPSISELSPLLYIGTVLFR